jgi:AraC-like DNA-binding protein
MKATNSDQISPLDGAIITSIRQITEHSKTEQAPFSSASLPGHLIHIVTAGRVEQVSGGLLEKIGPGDSVWYWENEPILGTVTAAPWNFYSINFTAPSLPPPPLTERVKPASSRTVTAAQEMHRIWASNTIPRLERQLKLHQLLLEILIELLSQNALSQCAETETALWWKVEATVRHDLSQPFRLATICKMFHTSERSLFRACNRATGSPPMRRIRQLRLSYARGLLLHSNQTISEIAYRVGYKRVQEFSRDYKKWFGCTPSQAKSPTSGSDLDY